MSKNEKGDEGEVEGKRVAGQCVNMTKVQEMCLKKDSPTPHPPTKENGDKSKKKNTLR